MFFKDYIINYFKSRSFFDKYFEGEFLDIDAVMQLKNYKNMLQQDAVKKAFENRGIQYYNPEINLVIGRRKDIPIGQWRSLIEEYYRMKILTYDDLFKQAQFRVNALKELL